MKPSKFIPLQTTHILMTYSHEKISSGSRQGIWVCTSHPNFLICVSHVFMFLIPAWPPGSSPHYKRERKRKK